MSRRLPSTQRPRVYQPTSDNPYQGTTEIAPASATHLHSQNPAQYTKDTITNKQSTSLRPGGVYNRVPTYDTGLSDETFTDTNSYYDFNYEIPYQNSCKQDSRSTDGYSYDDASIKLPYYDNNDTSLKRYSRNNISGRSFSQKTKQLCRDSRLNASIHKDARRVYPNNQEHTCDGQHSGSLRCTSSSLTNTTTLPTRVPLSRLSDRPQSSLSSGVTSAAVDGCGGRCQTFENVCYYFLQVVFTMGILIGTSLCIAGAVLRKSAARNLQVLVYIGVLLSLVSALLLGIQCNARTASRLRKKALRSAKKTAIQMSTLHPTVVAAQQPLMPCQPPRTQPVAHSYISISQPQRQTPVVEEHQGVPWWRRKDIIL